MGRARPIRGAGVAVLVALALAGCTSPGGNKAGGPGKPVVLRMATVNGDPGVTPQVGYLVDRVGKLSAGNVRIDMVYDVGHENPDAEQQAVKGVGAGTYELGVVGTRVFDTLGVSSFQALTAPMLIDSYPLEQAVVSSDIPARMLRSLDKVNVTGLGVLADGLRKPIAVHKPLLSPNHWKGIRFAAFRSNEAAEAIRALGARPSDLWGSHLDQGLDSGEVQGFEKSLFIYRSHNMGNRAPYITANVNLWPQTLAVIGNPGRLAEITAQQRGWLEQALRDAAARSIGLVDGDPGLLPGLCTAGTRFANASHADIAALRHAFAPVYAQLEQDVQTKGFIAEIEQLKQHTSSGQALVIPKGCTGAAPGPTHGGASTGSATKTTTATPLDGVWEVSYTRAEFLAAHPDPSEDLPENYGHFTLKLHRGDVSETSRGHTDTGTYVVDGDTIAFHQDSGAVWRYRWSVYRGTLTFKKLGGQEPDCSLDVSLGQCEPTGYVVKPWRRVSA